MSTGRKFGKLSRVMLLCLGVLWVSVAQPTDASAQQGEPVVQPKPKRLKKTTKAQKPQLPPLPSGPTGPVQQVPLDSMSPVPPQVSYQNSQLTINAPNSTLGDILRAVRKQTGAEIEIPSASERVVTHLGPGPAREVMAELLNGSRFNYVLLGSPADNSVLTRIVLVAKAAAEANPNPAQMAEQQQQLGMIRQPGNPGVPGAEQEPNGMAPPDESAEDAAADQAAAEAEQPPQPTDQNGVKTPQQMLQEMQQRQMQMQQQQQMGQPPAGQGVPPQPQPQPPPQQQ